MRILISTFYWIIFKHITKERYWLESYRLFSNKMPNLVIIFVNFQISFFHQKVILIIKIVISHKWYIIAIYFKIFFVSFTILYCFVKIFYRSLFGAHTLHYVIAITSLYHTWYQNNKLPIDKQYLIIKINILPFKKYIHCLKIYVLIFYLQIW